MKIIFLDIDGVVTSVRTGWYNFDIYTVNFLRWLCEVEDNPNEIRELFQHKNMFADRRLKK